MHVELSPEWERFVAARIAAGEFDSPEAVVAAALDRLAAETDMFVGWDPDELRAEIQKGLDQLENGQSRVFHSAEEMCAHFTRLRETAAQRRDAGE